MMPLPSQDDPDRSDYERRKTRRVLTEHLLDAALIGAPFGAIIIWMIVTVPSWRAMQWAMCCALAIWIVGFTRQWRRFHRMRCGGCGAKLRRRGGPDGQRVVFACDTCRIVWDTGFTECHDAGG